MEYTDVCTIDDVPPGRSRAVRIAGKDIALFNVAGDVHAIENACLHQGAALSGGELCGHIVKCRAHGWRFDVTTGELAGSRGKLCVAVFPVQVAGGRVAVAVAPA